jgi:hypothetical protein
VKGEDALTGQGIELMVIGCHECSIYSLSKRKCKAVSKRHAAMDGFENSCRLPELATHLCTLCDSNLDEIFHCRERIILSSGPSRVIENLTEVQSVGRAPIVGIT